MYMVYSYRPLKGPAAMKDSVPIAANPPNKNGLKLISRLSFGCQSILRSPHGALQLSLQAKDFIQKRPIRLFSHNQSRLHDCYPVLTLNNSV